MPYFREFSHPSTQAHRLWFRKIWQSHSGIIVTKSHDYNWHDGYHFSYAWGTEGLVPSGWIPIFVIIEHIAYHIPASGASMRARRADGGAPLQTEYLQYYYTWFYYTLYAWYWILGGWVYTRYFIGEGFRYHFAVDRFARIEE
jgi:hypothetical protein